jgi:hypothetical protein
MVTAVVSAACAGTAQRPSSTPEVVTTTVAPAGAPTTTARPATSTSGQDASAAARVALSGFLAGMPAQDPKAVLAHSEGGAAALGAIRALISDINAASGATTRTKLQDEAFRPQTVTPTAVVFAGSVGLTTEIQGPKGSQKSVSAISGPVTVALAAGTWRVKDFAYDGKRMVYEAEYATDTQAAVQLHVGLVLSYANTTTAVVALTTQSQSVGLTFTNATLTTSAGTSPSTGSGFTKGAQPTGFISFARTDAVPTRLVASFRQADGSAVAFTVALSGQPS